ncbi:MAG: hypothetical protein AUH72_04660 [Acidobacteria bacterium 13_1_40CM_4_65_8]|nr:MAG: hypothetical protein AUH72_04660 [Acidobacteria bacterium 13_1_40CM_4_65_8]
MFESIARAAALIATWCACALVAQAPRTDARAVVFEGARLITGDGRVIERSAFVVQDGTFTSVGRQGEVKPPPGATHVDLAGKTVMPALVDVHTHLGYRKGATFAAENFTRENVLDELNRFAYYGVAAVQTCLTGARSCARPGAGSRHPAPARIRRCETRPTVCRPKRKPGETCASSRRRTSTSSRSGSMIETGQSRS